MALKEAKTENILIAFYVHYTHNQLHSKLVQAKAEGEVQSPDYGRFEHSNADQNFVLKPDNETSCRVGQWTSAWGSANNVYLSELIAGNFFLLNSELL